MSAIFGLIRLKKGVADAESTSALNNAMSHRAAQGSFLWQQPQLVLGFCKSEIYNRNLKDSGLLETEHIVLVAEARIDNREELFKALGVNEQLRDAISDAALILKAFLRWEKNCLQYLDGAYAFAVWDKISQELFMATDHIGFRPLYYYQDTNEFIFCSEIKGIKAVKGNSLKFNQEHLEEYLYRQGDPAQTYLKAIKLLCGGHSLNLKSGKVQLNSYWKLDDRGKYKFLKDNEWTDCLRSLLLQAVDKRMADTDVRIGVTLSGGLDSSSIACLLAQRLAKQNRSLYAFSSVLPNGYRGPYRDERAYIELVNKHCPNIIQTDVLASTSTPFGLMSEAFKKHETFPNPFFYMDEAITNEAKSKGIELLFSGYGGDYGVSRKGNKVIYELLRDNKLALVLQLINQMSNLEQIKWISVLKREVLSHFPLITRLKGLLRQKEDNILLRSFAPQGMNPKMSYLNEQTQLQMLLQNGKIGKLVGRLCNTYAYDGIVAADPMFDRTVMEFLMEVPNSLFVKDGIKRNLLRRAMAGIVPEQILNRNDKNAYSPDYKKRINDSQHVLQSLMDADSSQFIFEQYLNRTLLQKWMTASKIDLDKTDIRIAQTGIICLVLAHLKDQGDL